MRLHTSGKASLIKVLERSIGRGRTRRCTLENILQIVVVVEVEPADGQELLGAFELATDDAVFPTGVGPQGQSTVGQSCRLVRKRFGVWISASNRTARMGPIMGICCSNLMFRCFRPSASSSRRTS